MKGSVASNGNDNACALFAKTLCYALSGPASVNYVYLEFQSLFVQIRADFFQAFFSGPFSAEDVYNYIVHARIIACFLAVSNEK